MLRKKLATLLIPFVLAPLASLLTPMVARADYSYWIPVKRCVFPSFRDRDYTPWSAKIVVRSRDRAAHVTQIQFGNGGNDERIIRLQYWGTNILRPGDYRFNPGILSWNQSINPPWVRAGVRREFVIRLFNADRRQCTSKTSF
jgi:hypothetical protein